MALQELRATLVLSSMAKRFKYFIGCVVSLALAVLAAFQYGGGVEQIPLAEIAILFVIVMILAFLMGRASDREDETAGIVSLDDDD